MKNELDLGTFNFHLRGFEKFDFSDESFLSKMETRKR